MEAPAAPGLLESAAAVAAREHLRGVEKHLDNEGLMFSKETVQLLENAVKAIRELEEERKHTLDALEEETIKNCNLRVRIKGYPEIVMKEFEELVAAAHRTRFQKLKEMEISIQDIAAAVESTYSNQKLAEECNVLLCEEQEQLRAKYDEIVKLMNQNMAAKHSTNIEINDLHNLKKEEEEEILDVQSAIEDVKAEMQREAADFREMKALLEAQIADLQRRIEDMKRLAIQKGEEYAELVAILEALEQEIAGYNQSIAIGREKLAELFKQIREMLKEYEEKKAEKEELLKKKALVLLAEKRKVAVAAKNDRTGVSGSDQEPARTPQAEEKLSELLRINKRLKNENNLLKTQYQALTDEEDDFCAQRDRLAREFERLSNLLTERLDKVAKRLVETRDLQEEIDRLQEVFDNTQGGYSREIGNLEVTLQKEGDKRAGLQEQLADIAERYQKMQEDHEALLKESKEKNAANKRRLAELTRENDRLKKEIQKSTDAINFLTSQLRRKEAFYKKRDEALRAEIKALEEELDAMTQRLQEKEELLNVNRPLAEKLQMELEEKTANFSNQKDLYTALMEEERTLTKSIEKSTREINKLKRFKLSAKSELHGKREVILEQLRKFTNSLKLLEKENYEMDRVMYILNAENDRLRAGIAHLREDIATMESEGETYQSKRQQTQKNRKILYEHFDMRWFKDHFLHKMFLKYQHEVMNTLVEYLTRNKRRIETLDYVHDGLQLNCDAMDMVFKHKSVIKR
ncbi:hypothetical protein lerEdw1_001654 [Lerista edwardsae]|nr:hypothetical protein lerEdw1_001654 [Lerista edwardsae]